MNYKNLVAYPVSWARKIRICIRFFDFLSWTAVYSASETSRAADVMITNSSATNTSLRFWHRLYIHTDHAHSYHLWGPKRVLASFVRYTRRRRQRAYNHFLFLVTQLFCGGKSRLSMTNKLDLFTRIIWLFAQFYGAFDRCWCPFWRQLPTLRNKILDGSIRG